MTSPLRTAIVGCGNIARAYAIDMRTYDNVSIAGFFDLDTARAKAFADEFGGKCYESLEAVLQDSAVELVVNLTIHHAHEEVIAQSLTAGKHVHTEKPLALSYAGAQKLLALAEKRGLRLSSAPTTFLGEPQQTVASELRRNAIGPVRLVYAEMNHGRIETWHPNPEPFYRVGPLWDVGIYPLTLLTAFLGPVKSVSSIQRMLKPDRVTKDGRPFHLSRPEFILAALDFESGIIGRLTCNFYAKSAKQGNSIEFNGDGGTLWLGNVFSFDGPVEKAGFGEPMKPVSLVRPGTDHTEFARGVHDLAAAIAENRPHRADGRHAAHVIEIMDAIDRSAADDGKPVPLSSTFTQPTPMEWAL